MKGKPKPTLKGQFCPYDQRPRTALHVKLSGAGLAILCRDGCSNRRCFKLEIDPRLSPYV